MHFIMSHQKWDTKVLKKKMNPSDLHDQWLKWETENTHLRGKKVSLQLCSFLASLVCTEKKNLLYFFVKERQCIRLFWSLCLFELGILWDVIHKCFAAHHFLQIECILWLRLWGETVRMGSLLWPCQDMSFEEGTSGWVHSHACRVGLFVLFCKEILSSHFIFSSLFAGVQMCWRSVFQFSTYV